MHNLMTYCGTCILWNNILQTYERSFENVGADHNELQLKPPSRVEVIFVIKSNFLIKTGNELSCLR